MTPFFKVDDDSCFLYSVLAAKMWMDGRVTNKHLERLSHYKNHLHELDQDGLEMPMAIDQIKRFVICNSN